MTANLPSRLGGSPQRRVTLGAVQRGVSPTMPPGRYLLVLLGDGQIHLSVPLVGAATTSAPAPARHRTVTFAEVQGAPSLKPAATGLYSGHLSLPLTPLNDPQIVTQSAVTYEDTTNAWDIGSCLRRTEGTCPQTDDPRFGTGTLNSGGSGYEELFAYYDGTDFPSGERGMVASTDYRSLAAGARLYATLLAVSGANS